MIFRYTAVDEKGKKTTGVIRDKTQKEILKELSAKNLTVMSLEEISGHSGGGPGEQRSFLPVRRRVSTEEKIVMNLQFANLLGASLSIIETIDIISGQTKNIALKSGLKDIKKDIEKGVPIYEAFRNSGLFDDLTVNMLKAGEESSRLDQIFSRLSSFAERQFYVMQNVKSVLAYPLILLVMGGLLTAITMIFVFPKFIEIFNAQEIELPAITRAVAWVSFFIAKFWYVFLAVLLAAFFSAKKYLKTDKGKLSLSRFVLKIPYVRGMISKLEFSRFFYSLQLLLGSGVDIIDSIEYAKGTLNNLLFRDYMETVKKEVQKGTSFSEALARNAYVPEVAVKMVTVGEKTGELEPFLERAAAYLEVIFNYQVKRVIVFIEPAILVLMGAFIGILMASFLLPLFRIVRVIRT